MADVLQKLIKAEGNIRHPLMEGPCPVLQYADDTHPHTGRLGGRSQAEADTGLILGRTGLAIIFHKSTVTPMHIQREALQDMMQVLQGLFPQVYLGLPFPMLSCGFWLLPPDCQSRSVPRRMEGYL